jgi:hypothetical protein
MEKQAYSLGVISLLNMIIVKHPNYLRLDSLKQLE